MGRSTDTPRETSARPEPLILTPEQIVQVCEMTDGKLTPLDVEMILELTPVGTQFPDFRRYVKRCVTLGLDPTANEIHMEYRFQHGRTQALFVIHVDGYRKMAHATGSFAGFKQVYGEDAIGGKYVESVVYRKDSAEPFTGRTYANEFTDDSDIWRNKKLHMTGKTSESLAYKRAFAFSGTITEEEVTAFFDRTPREPEPPAAPMPPQKEESASTYEVGEIPIPAPEPDPITVIVPEIPTSVIEPPPEPVAQRDLRTEYMNALSALVAQGCNKAMITGDYLRAYFGVEMNEEIRKLPAIDVVFAMVSLQAWLKYNGAIMFNDSPINAARQIQSLRIVAA